MNPPSPRLASLLRLLKVYFLPVGPHTSRDIDRLIAERYPGLPGVSGRQLAEELAAPSTAGTTASPSPPAPVLLDARSPEEFAVSHLPGARRANSLDDARKWVPDPTTPVIVYCALGYRAALLADRLREAGYRNVRLLEGSIFGWANEGRPLTRDPDEGPATKVHPCSRKWGKLLEPDRCWRGNG